MAATTIGRATITDATLPDGSDGDTINAAVIGTAIYDKIDALFTAATFVLESAHSGADKYLKVANTANAASSGAYVVAEVGGTSAADAKFIAGIAGGAYWSWGIDNSDTDRFCLSYGLALGTTPVFQADADQYSYWAKPLILTEVAANPGTGQLSADAALAIYTKADKLVFAYNNGGTMTYITLDLDGSDTSLTHGTSAP